METANVQRRVTGLELLIPIHTCRVPAPIHSLRFVSGAVLPSEAAFSLAYNVPMPPGTFSAPSSRPKYD